MNAGFAAVSGSTIALLAAGALTWLLIIRFAVRYIRRIKAESRESLKSGKAAESEQ